LIRKGERDNEGEGVAGAAEMGFWRVRCTGEVDEYTTTTKSVSRTFPAPSPPSSLIHQRRRARCVKFECPAMLLTLTHHHISSLPRPTPAQHHGKDISRGCAINHQSTHMPGPPQPRLPTPYQQSNACSKCAKYHRDFYLPRSSYSRAYATTCSLQ